MGISITISKKMDNDDKIYGHRTIRFTKKMRDKYNYNIGDFVNIKTKSGKLMTLQIYQAFEEDILDNIGIYVSNDIFKILDLKNVSEYCDNNLNIEENITIGCDPEFFILDLTKNSIIKPYNYFNKWGEIGYDGHAVEFRPRHSINEDVVVDNIWELINKTRDNLNKMACFPNNIVMIAASELNGIFAGFHLHYGLPQELNYLNNIKHSLARQIIKTMDYYVGVPAIIPEGSNDSMRRCSTICIYGKPGDYRFKNTLEYRVPGGYLLRHPILTRGLLALGIVVMEDIISRIKTYTNKFHSQDLLTLSAEKDLREFYPNLPSIKEIVQIMCTPTTTTAMKYIHIIMNDVEQMVGFKKRSKAITELFDVILSNKQFCSNIEINWRKFYNDR